MTQSTRKPRISLIGVGLMGSRMGARLLKAGYGLNIRDRSQDKCRDLAAKGAFSAASVAEAVHDADIVLTSLADAQVIDLVYFGEDGIVPNASKDSLIIDTSSQAPDLARKLHKRLAEAGYKHHLDAPVSGGISGAASGTLSIMVGGAKRDLQRGLPVLEILGDVFHLGDAGAGQVCKMVNQAIVHVTIGAISEGLMLAAALGVDAGRVREAIGGGYCQSRILEVHGEKMVNRDFTPGGPLQYSVKDMKQVMKFAEAADLTLPLSRSILAQFSRLHDSGRGSLDHSALILAYEEANAPIRVSPDKEDILP